MTTCERGDVILINVPINEELEMRARPALVLHDCSHLDPTISIAPLTPDPMVGCNALLVPMGTYEAARMGLVTSTYMNAVDEILVNRHFFVRTIGRCPQRLIRQFLAMYRAPLGFRSGQEANGGKVETIFNVGPDADRAVAFLPSSGR